MVERVSDGKIKIGIHAAWWPAANLFIAIGRVLCSSSRLWPMVTGEYIAMIEPSRHVLTMSMTKTE